MAFPQAVLVQSTSAFFIVELEVAIYTKTGDKGKTSLYSAGKAKRVEKDSAIVEALGAVDELNCALGVAKTYSKKYSKRLITIQKCLLTIGSSIAGSGLKIASKETRDLERDIDEWEGSLPALANFIIPGGSAASAQVHFCRSLARRAERRVVAVNRHLKLDKNTLKYLNRLSDYLFMLARKINYDAKLKEEIWKGK